MRRKFFYFYGILSLLSFIASAIYVFILPKNTTFGWGFNEATSKVKNPLLLLVITLIPLTTVAFQALLYKFSPMKNSKGEKAFTIISGCLTCFMIVSTWMFILSVKQGDYTETSIRVILVFLGAMLIIIGNYMPVIEQNSFIGVRTPWTLKNEIVWKKSQLVGGVGFLLSGISTILLAFLNSEVALVAIVVELVLVGAVVTAYSYVLYKKIEK